MDSRLKLVLVFLVVPYVVMFFTEFFDSVLIWYVRIVDFFDFVFLGPFYFVLFILMYNSLCPLREHQDSEFSYDFSWVHGVFLVSLFLFFEGHAMHVTANALDTFSFEVRDYEGIVPHDMRLLLHFLDEFLGHALLFTGLMGVLVSFCLFEFRVIATSLSSHSSRFLVLSRQERVLSLVTGFVFGVGLTVAAIEATYFIWYWNAFGLLVLLWLIVKWRRGSVFWDYMVYFRVVVAASFTIPFATLAYWLIFNGFVPVSTLL